MSDFFDSIRLAAGHVGKLRDDSWRSDELARRTNWQPLTFGCASSGRTHCLKVVDTGGSMCFAPNIPLSMLSWPLFAVAAAGLAVMLLSLGVEPFHHFFFGFPLLYLLDSLVMAGMIAAGLVLRKVKPLQIVFDCRRQIFYKTKQTLSADTDYAVPETAVPFADIGALQLLEIWSPGLGTGNSNNYFYQLNIVRKNAKRVNVITEGGYEMLLAEAGRIAQTLEIPLWDDVYSSTVRVKEWPVEYAKE